MAFHDALFGEPAEVDGIFAVRADNGLRLMKVLDHGHGVAVTWLGLPDVLGIRVVDLLVDARMQKHRVTPDLRAFARLTIGLGPGFCVNSNCDIAVETRPPKNGAIVRRGSTDVADGVASRLGDVGSERFAYSALQGRWRASHHIGTPILKAAVVGFLNDAPVHAPLGGVVRGIVRDSIDVPSGVKLLEIDPRGPGARWTGIDDRGRTIAKATLNAIRIHVASIDATWAAAASHPT
jgi:hypothetical protein